MEPPTPKEDVGLLVALRPARPTSRFVFQRKKLFELNKTAIPGLIDDLIPKICKFMSSKGLLRFKAASRTTRRVVRERYTIHQILLEDGHQQAEEQEQEDVGAGDRRQDDDHGDGLQFPFDDNI